MNWFSRLKAPKITSSQQKSKLPDGLWTKCPSCSEYIFTADLKKNLHVCPRCSYHFKMPARERIAMLIDEDTFEEHGKGITSGDPLSFKDSKKYKDRIKAGIEKTGESEAYIYGDGKIKEIPVALGVFVFPFLGGSMGSAVGEKVARTFELAADKKVPAIVVCASGGARMQEGILSLMQMAKTSVALSRLKESGIPYISVLTDPTTGGVAASFAMQADVIVAEPGALIGFAGPRVIEQTIKEKLPEGFQRSEFLLEHGMVDCIVNRKELKDTLAAMLDMMYGHRS